MFPKLLPTLAAVWLSVAAAPAQTAPKKSALDKATLEAYVRHMYVMDSRINVQISDPKPSAVPGFLDVTVHASMGPQTQDIQFLVSKDGSAIVQGTVYDINHNPFKPELDKLKTEGAPGTGTAGAPVAIVEFSDFECPYCKEEAKLLHDNLLAAYPKQVRLYFKEFPLDTLHPWARSAAMMGRCVLKQSAGDFWTYHDWIFGDQDKITPENFKDTALGWAKDVKDLDTLKLSQCYDARATEAEVNKSVAEGQALGVNSTPTLFVNGRRIAQAIDWNSLQGHYRLRNRISEDRKRCW